MEFCGSDSGFLGSTERVGCGNNHNISCVAICRAERGRVRQIDLGQSKGAQDLSSSKHQHQHQQGKTLMSFGNASPTTARWCPCCYYRVLPIYIHTHAHTHTHTTGGQGRRDDVRTLQARPVRTVEAPAWSHSKRSCLIAHHRGGANSARKPRTTCRDPAGRR